MAFRASCVCIAAALAFAPVVCGQSPRTAKIGRGAILVASRQLRDPNFAHSVVLLAQYQEDGVMGLVLNRPSTIPISRALSIPEAKNRTELLYLGGPVERTSLTALGRLTSAASGAVPVFRGLYLIVDKKLLAKTIGASPGAGALRIYAGYAGWSGPQLRHEVEVGGWVVLPGTPAIVFDADPRSLWTRLIEQTERSVARNGLDRPGGLSHLIPLRVSEFR